MDFVSQAFADCQQLEEAMTVETPQPTTMELWNILRKEITGIQILWEVVERLYFKPQHNGLAALELDTPILFRLAQTTLMESLLMRLSRLMYRADSNDKGGRPNLSLKRLQGCSTSVKEDVDAVSGLWDASNLKNLRDKYQSHNDLTRSLGESHTLSIPLEPADIEAMRSLANSLRDLRRVVHSKLTIGVAYLDEGLDRSIQHEIDVLSNSLWGGQLFFELLPDHGALQQAWREVEHG